jgi:hypothetical protein
MARRSLCAVLLAFSLGTATNALAVTLPGSDDFDDNTVDPALWGADLGTGTLSETNQRLEYTVSPAADALPIRPWILSPASYDEDWSIQLDLHVGDVGALLDGQDLLFGVGISDGASTAAVILEYENVGGTLLRGFHAVNEGPGGVELMVPTAAIDGAGRLSFDSLTKELHYWYDDDGAAGGYNWLLFQTVDLDAPGTDWGLAAGAELDVGVFAESHGIVVASGDAYGDNFASSGLLLLGAARRGSRHFRART